MYLDVARKSPSVEYRDNLLRAIKQSGKTKWKVADEADLSPANLSNMLAGRRKPLLDYQKNLMLARACGQGEGLANDLQSASLAYHAIERQPLVFRRHMAVLVRAVESLLDKINDEIVMIQDLHKEGKKDTEIDFKAFVPESLLAAKKLVNSLRYWWPVEQYDKWKDFPDIQGRILKRLKKLSPNKRINAIVQMEVGEALEWVRDQGDLNPFVEKNELIRRLAKMLGVEEDELEQIASALVRISSRNPHRKGELTVKSISKSRRQDKPK